MINLIVNGQVLDLFKKETFAISKAISKLGDFDLRHGDVSISFKVPSTAKNVAILGYLSSLNNYNLAAFKRFDGEIREDESVLSSGYFQVIKIDQSKSNIELRFFGGNSDWFDLIKKRDINKTYLNETIGGNQKSYSFDEYNHKFEGESIKASWDNDDGYFYFPIDSGADSNRATSNNFTVDDFQLGVFQHTIVKKIFDSIGVKLQGSLFNDPLYFNSLVNLPIDMDQFSKKNNEKRFTVGSNNQTISTSTPEAINYANSDHDNQWDGGTFTSKSDIDTINFSLDLLLNGANFAYLGDIELTIKYTINGVPQTDSVNIIPQLYSQNLAETEMIKYNVETFSFNSVKIGDTFEFLIRTINSAASPSFKYTIFDGFNFEYKGWVEGSFSYSLDGLITPYNIVDAMPEINQATFIKDVMFRHGAVSQFNSKTRTLTINKFQDLEQKKHLSVDYSDKIDLSKPPVFDFTKVLKSFKRTSKIIYAEDDADNELSIFNKKLGIGLGNASKEIDNDNLNGEGVVYESVFSATSQGWTFPYPVDGSDSLSKFYLPNMRYSVDVEDVKEFNARILLKAGKLDVESFNKGGYIDILFNGNYEGSMGYAYFAKQSLNETGLTDTSLNLNLDTLAFDNQKQSTTNYIGNTLLEKNYGLYFDILKQPIHLSIYLNVNALDIQQLDFFKPIWLDFSLGRGYYYLDNVSQYKGDGTSTKFELVKI